MRFRVLGPLEAVAADGPVVLGGARQRATLGFLLLHANEVVATSRLLRALWPPDDIPLTARKVVQNAVWGLRRTLAAHAGAEAGAEAARPADAVLLPAGAVPPPAAAPGGWPTGPELVTQAPGYLLRVDPAQVDLHRFRQLAAQGRERLAAGAADAAARVLAEALALWRGPVLADLAEAGVAWPELAAVRRARLDALEDRFEAELARGRHHAVLGDLETVAEAEPLRERLCGQLMLALYRCGRQADALGAYAWIRARLAEGRGLEPGRGLRGLQHAILTHDPGLALPAARERAEVRPAVTVTRAAPEQAAARRRAVVAERREVGVVLLRTRPADGTRGAEGAEADAALDADAAAVRQRVESFGGRIAAAAGPVTLALFGLPTRRADARRGSGRGADAPERAVRAALALRDTLAASGTALHAAVTLGEALVRYAPEDPELPPSAVGTLLDRSFGMLSRVPVDEVRVCDATARATESAIAYHRVSGRPGGVTGWRALGVRRAPAGQPGPPLVDRDHEPGVLAACSTGPAARAPLTW
ncbi:AfsR/SARP family transcriptional regulator [Streptomyces sp. B1866]|uniref:AfsR/SARP family transcriptional regulator n=1 Tax=Streptomyces sp. B1866 TaxID=3075431 RepID=UPI00288E38C1|nr:AfsR/SARP family transcriptional regulator [Streptomyces sp. B1866]MDT3399936.1 AfsR/SARP family transcriptional regulator [Streptomyces sp. B1866]